MHLLFTGLLLCLFILIAQPALAKSDECVIVLHGLGRTSLSMSQVASALEDDGYVVWNEGYPSRKAPIEELTAVVDDAIGWCRNHDATRIHFVTHSMGGILVRYYFQTHEVPEAKRVVMLAPPNQGSEVTDQYRDEWWYQFATGPAGQQLGTGEDSVPRTLEPIPLEIGIIAGRKTSDPWFADLFDGANDGKVSVQSTRLEGMDDFLLVESGHTFIMNSDEVIAQILAFLHNGQFVQADSVNP